MWLGSEQEFHCSGQEVEILQYPGSAQRIFPTANVVLILFSGPILLHQLLFHFWNRDHWEATIHS